MSGIRASSERRTRFSSSRASTCSSLERKRLRKPSTQWLGLRHGSGLSARRARCHTGNTEELCIAAQRCLLRSKAPLQIANVPPAADTILQPVVWPNATFRLSSVRCFTFSERCQCQLSNVTCNTTPGVVRSVAHCSCGVRGSPRTASLRSQTHARHGQSTSLSDCPINCAAAANGAEMRETIRALSACPGI